MLILDAYAFCYDTCANMLFIINPNYLTFPIKKRKGFYRYETQSKVPSAQNIPYGI